MEKKLTIKCHKKTGANLYLFFKHDHLDLGVPLIYWNRINSDLDELVLIATSKKQITFINKVKNEVEKTGFVPYHYNVQFNTKGKKILQDDTKVQFTGLVINYTKFKSVNGDFWLIGYTDGTHNYISKKYVTNEATDNVVIYSAIEEKLITGRIKATIKDIDGNPIYLINYVRIKDV